MACYIITFEPTDTNAATAIRERLRSLGGYCPVHAYCWAIVTKMTAVQLRDHLTQASPNSRIFVIRSGTESAWRHSYGEKNNEWLKNNL